MKQREPDYRNVLSTRRFKLSVTIQGIMMRIIRRITADRTGGTAIEYALVAALISAAGFTAFQTIGDELRLTYANFVERLHTANESS